jgi:hypothetical protein
MPGIVLAWATGTGIIFYRTWKNDHAPALPGQLLAASFIFIACGLLADSARTSFLGSALAWGFDIAAFLNLAPGVTTGGATDGTGPSLTHEPAGEPAQTGTGGRTT